MENTFPCKYDVFISYRHSYDFSTAKLLCGELEKRKYIVFFDKHNQCIGKFPDRLKKAVKDSENFILILSSGTLKRCSNPGDWVREEITIALEQNKKIIPVTFDANFDFPDELPPPLTELKAYQRILLNSDLYDASIENLTHFISSHIPEEEEPVKKTESSIPQDCSSWIRTFLILTILPALAMILFFTGRAVASKQIGNKNNHVAKQIAFVMNPEIRNGKLYFKADYKDKCLTYDITSDSMNLTSRSTPNIKQLNYAEIVLGSAFIANTGLWAYFKALPSKLKFLKKNNKEAIIATTSAIIICSSYYLGKYTVEKELNNPFDSDNTDFLIKNHSLIKRNLFLRFWGYSEENNFDNFDINAIHSTLLKEKIAQSNKFRDTILTKLKTADFIPTANDFNQLFTRFTLYNLLYYGCFNYAKQNLNMIHPKYPNAKWTVDPELLEIFKKADYLAPLVIRLERNPLPEQTFEQKLTSWSLFAQATKSEYDKTIFEYGIFRQIWKFLKRTYNANKVTLQTGDLLIKYNQNYVLTTNFSQQNVINRHVQSVPNVGSFLVYRPSTSKLLNVYIDSDETNAYFVQVPIWDNKLTAAINVAFPIFITNIKQGSFAEKYGLKCGDIILSYAESELIDGNNRMYRISQQIRASYNKEKRLIFARKQNDGSFVIFEHTFPPGEIGFFMRDFCINMQIYERLFQDYKNFKASKKQHMKF